MKKICANLAGCICFILILAVLTVVFTPKYLENDEWPTTSTVLGFYEMEEDSVDVLFLGSSQSMTSFIPQEIYNETGITSYNLSTEQQNILLSYYWLKEALRTQHPKVVVLDCDFLFPSISTDNPLNAEEPFVRKAMDFMRWSPIKTQAIRDICTYDTDQDQLSYYFPLLRYHGRWKYLKKEDVTFFFEDHDSELKGFNNRIWVMGENDYHTYDSIDEADKPAKMMENMAGYLDRIEELCRQEQIDLVLVKTPATTWSAKKALTMENYAKEHGITFVDYNRSDVFHEMGYLYEQDMTDALHPNMKGALKLTSYLMPVLKEKVEITQQTDPQFEETRASYEKTKEETMEELWKITEKTLSTDGGKQE